MSRLFVYDENMTDERAKITVAKMAAISDIVAPVKEYIQYSDTGTVTIAAGCVIAVGENAVFKTIIIFIFATPERMPRMKFI